MTNILLPPNERDWLNPSSAREPLIWVQQVRLLYRFEAGDDAEIRRILLHRGINIVWAKPADIDEPNPQARGRGHDVGKTSFCRLIRYLLGEDHYGNKKLRQAISNSEKLNRAWVVGEVFVDGECWTVARPLYTGAHHFALGGVSIDESFDKPASERIRHEDFVAELQRKLISRFAVQTFDDVGLRPIRWVHVLQWLARDQESHLSGLFRWRDVTSDHGSPELDADDAQFLARCVLNVTDVEERRQIERRKKLSQEKEAESANIRYYQRRIDDALQRARDELPDGADLPKVGETLFVDVVVRHARQLSHAKRQGFERELGKLDLPTRETALEQAIAAKALVESKRDELKQLVDEMKDALDRFIEKPAKTKQDVDDLDAILAKLNPDRAFCEIPVNIALFRCPLLQEKRLGVEAPALGQEAVPDLAEQRRKQVQAQLEGLNRNFRQVQAQLDSAVRKENASRIARDSVRTKETQLKQQIAALDQDAATWKVRAEDANLSFQRLETARSRLQGIDSDIETSKAAQDQAQKAVQSRQNELAQLYKSVCQFFKGANPDHELKFTRDEIRARIGAGGGASTALSSLTFDLSALIAALNGIGNHPCFLIHDSPRESDMEQSLYRPVFQLARNLEKASGNSFQYIITTTEAPPQDMSAAPYLCLSLDGTTPEGKLFKEDL